ncbi:U-box domain-containing protein 1 [Chenopodium quinoa]|uniref:U-box domain-containing protein 1 n=1 Tax=Chenopodium quinoa TaxID=63459 RepID=UPI000B7993C8|nr:U-box domain-containing protein 1 [Chenopodium quinoa]
MELEVKRRTTKSLISKLSSVSDQTRIAALCELRLLTKNDPEIRPIIAEEDEGAAISLLAETLYSPTPLAQENAAATLLNLSISCKKSIMSTRGVLDSLSYILSNHRTHPPAAVQSAAAAIYSLSVEENYRSVIGGKRDVVYSLIDIVGFRESPSRSIKDGLKALFGLSLCPLNRPLMVEFGAIESIFRVVVRDGRIGVIEDATAVIAQVAGCVESVEAFRKAAGVRVLVDLLNPETGSSSRIKENAVSGLLNLVKIGGEEVGEEIREVGLGLVFDGLGEVVDSGSDKGKKRAQALLKILEDGMSLSHKDANDSGSDLYSGPLVDTSNSFSY